MGSGAPDEAHWRSVPVADLTGPIAHPTGAHRATYLPAVVDLPAAILIEPPQATHNRDLASLNLTPRQLQVLELVRSGRANAAIAQQLGVSERTVAHHLDHIYRRLDVATRTAALARVDQLSRRAVVTVRLGVACPSVDTGEPEFGTPSGIYGLQTLPARFTLA